MRQHRAAAAAVEASIGLDCDKGGAKMPQATLIPFKPASVATLAGNQRRRVRESAASCHRMMPQWYPLLVSKPDLHTPA